jgi:hypothetical protein
VLVAAAAIRVAEQPLRAALGVWTQPVAHVHGQDEPVVGGSGLRQRGQDPPQPDGVDTAVVQGGVQRAVSTPVFGQQCQVHWRHHPPLGAQQCVGELEQFVPVRVQARVEVAPEA